MILRLSEKPIKDEQYRKLSEGGVLFTEGEFEN
jgi:hypothetical protein